MWEHLWAEKPAPVEYLDFLLCERFGWTPYELADLDADIVFQFLTMWDVEQKVQKAKKDPTGRRDANLPT